MFGAATTQGREEGASSGVAEGVGAPSCPSSDDVLSFATSDVVAGVGVRLAVEVFVGVFVIVPVRVAVGVRVLVKVMVAVGVLVQVMVLVGVKVGVLVGVLVAVAHIARAVFPITVLPPHK